MENKIADGEEEAWQITLEGNEAVSDTEFCLVDVDRVVDGDSSTFDNHLLGCHRLSNGKERFGDGMRPFNQNCTNEG
ncbi:hypothetical protein ES319_D13G053000v1 [Gossypium barbadense]|uniref:Uncharacterized protein n=1 Tax=Gossypium barbadense TaxID=3634 RepID=A0A5J5NKC3_GOSBA|nr:hypothetical protein ES319_D13G053000v1 [Gossypium barbadense]